jgi:DNA-binding NtrC family response regulator
MFSKFNLKLPEGYPTGFKRKEGRVVIIDDDSEMQNLLFDFFNSEGYTVHRFSSAFQALDSFDKALKDQEDPLNSVDLVISDIKMPKLSGLDFIAKLKSSRPEIPVILITAFGSIETAIDAMKKGAFDYIVKPFKLAELAIVAERAIKFNSLERDNQFMREQIQSTWSLDNLVGKSHAMAEIFEVIKKIAPTQSSVLISGESGSGKESLAHAIHKTSVRARKPFISLNCTSVPSEILEIELFGQIKNTSGGELIVKKSAFEEADGGTLFLDEVGDLSLSLQSKVLKVLKEQRLKSSGDSNHSQNIDVRIIASSHKDLKLAIKDGRFREDLYFKLNVVPIVLPPLRQRSEDIPLLADFFLKKFSIINNIDVRYISKPALNFLMTRKWEGNIRELENTIERAAALCTSNTIELEDLKTNKDLSDENFFGNATSDSPTIDQLEKRYIQLILEKTGGRKEKAAQILGINRRTLYRKERDYGLIDESEDSTSQEIEDSLD